MEGYFWRVTDVAGGRVLVVLCGVNRHPDGDWATIAIAAHPGGFVRSAVVGNAHAASDRFLVTAGDGTFTATGTGVHVDLGEGARADLSFERPVGWPLVLGGGGIFSALPFLGQYWHPHVLGGKAHGSARIESDTWELHDAEVYAEKNWGAGFPERPCGGVGPCGTRADESGATCTGVAPIQHSAPASSNPKHRSHLLSEALRQVLAKVDAVLRQPICRYRQVKRAEIERTAPRSGSIR
jgi:hypothetical protein